MRNLAAAVIATACLIAWEPIFAQARLKIVVVEGEDAVNVIQQKTATAPIVEVRDRNDQPIAGAIVNFAIRGGRATFGGARTLSVTTDVAGRAVAAGLTPTASGAVQISATAAFQGQAAAAVTITQTNVLTAAQAAAVSTAGASTGGTATGTGAGGAGGSGSAGTAGAGAGAGGGGLSATTIGIVGGAAAGGAVAAKQVLGNGDAHAYAGPFSIDWTVSCLAQRMLGTIDLEFEASSETPGTTPMHGSLSLKDTSMAVVNRPANCGILTSTQWGMLDADLIGTLGALEAHAQDRVTSLVNTQLDRNYDFRGSLANGVITGTFSMTWRDAAPPGLVTTGSTAVTLTRVQ